MHSVHADDRPGARPQRGTTRSSVRSSLSLFASLVRCVKNQDDWRPERSPSSSCWPWNTRA